MNNEVSWLFFLDMHLIVSILSHFQSIKIEIKHMKSSNYALAIHY